MSLTTSKKANNETCTSRVSLILKNSFWNGVNLYKLSTCNVMTPIQKAANYTLETVEEEPLWTETAFTVAIIQCETDTIVNIWSWIANMTHAESDRVSAHVRSRLRIHNARVHSLWAYCGIVVRQDTVWCGRTPRCIRNTKTHTSVSR